MKPLLTPDEMAAADQAAISAGTPASVLMDRAGRAVARAAIEMAGTRYGTRIAVVCGKGNNGGDGFVTARVLAREGAGVTCMTVGDATSVGGAAKEHLDLWTGSGGRVVPFDASELEDADVVIDAIFGTGFRGTAEGEAAAAIAAINASGAGVIAVDIPSGIDGSTGMAPGPAVEADVTITMAAMKVGLAIGDGVTHSGAVEIADIGMRVPEDVGLAMVQTSDVADVLPERSQDAHKRSSGTVAVLAGWEQMTGAALLTVRGGFRMGAGFSYLGCVEAVRAAAATRLPEALVQVVSDGPILVPESLERFKGVLEKATALVVGPGIATGAEQRELVERILREVELPVVGDADALNVLGEDPDVMSERDAPLIITPHPAELGRLLGRSPADVQKDRIGAVRDAAQRFDCVVVLKGFRTLIAAPGRAVVNPTGGPELATAGTGDVLAGAIGALAAAGLDPFEAAWAGVFVHGVAGAIAASDAGEGGVVAWDVAERLPRAIGSIRKGVPWD